MANPEHLKIFNKGVEVWNNWRKNNPEIKPDLQDIKISAPDLINMINMDLSIVNLVRAKFSNVDLSNTNLCGANLADSIFSNVDLTHTDLSSAYLTSATFVNAMLPDVNFISAVIINTNIKTALLDGADLNGSFIGFTMFCDTNLSKVENIDKCIPVGPNYIDYYTLMRSENIPDSFLKKCGLSDEFIEYIPSLRGQALDFYSCFISHSAEDKDFCDRLYADLQAKGIRCWYSPHDISGGKKVHEQLEHAIRIYDKLLLVLSEDSMNSEWVKTEIADARQKEIDTGEKVLFPIGLVDFEKIKTWKFFDADTGKDSAREIREFYVPDFSNWKKDNKKYQKELERLIKDLKGKRKQYQGIKGEK